MTMYIKVYKRVGNNEKFSYLIDMKTCNRCKQTLSLDNFYKNRRTPDGYDRRCGSCHKEYKKEQRVKLKEKKTWYVYYLPKEGYYGHTYHLSERMLSHRFSGRNIEGWHVIDTFNIKEDALRMERTLQDKIKTINKYVVWDDLTGDIYMIADFHKDIAKEFGYSSEFIRLAYKKGKQIYDRYTVKKMYYDTLT